MKRGILIFLLLIPLVQAAGVTPTSANLNFKPNLQTELQFNFFPTGANADIEATLSGDLAQYAILDKSLLKGGGTVTVFISLPKNLESGMHYINVVGTEVPSGGGGISAVTGITVPVRIFVPYEGKYIEASLEVSNINVNEKGIAYIKVKNIGTEAISELYAKILILSDEKELKKLETKKVSLNIEESKTLEATFLSGDLRQGSYKALAKIFFDGKEETLEKGFLVGDLVINILNYTSILREREINRFSILMESKWNTRIDELFAQIRLLDSNKEIVNTKTQQINFEPWEIKELNTFLDLTSVGAGEYDINIILNYANKQSNFIGKVKVVKIGPDIFTIFLLIIIIIIIIVWYLLIKKKTEKLKRVRRNA